MKTMDPAEFRALREQCSQSLQVWVQEASETCRMLGECDQGPLSLERRYALHQQRIRENEAHLVHMKLRQQLFDLARTGFEEADLLYMRLPE